MPKVLTQEQIDFYRDKGYLAPLEGIGSDDAAAMLEDLGFYSMAPLFIVGVTLLMGERRPQWIALTAALIMGVLLFTFVSLLYVGLPTGNISPFYDLSHWIVTMIQ